MKKSYNYSACAWYITALWMFIILIGIKNVIKIKLFYMIVYSFRQMGAAAVTFNGH